jgi:hypothetical protein
MMVLKKLKKKNVIPLTVAYKKETVQIKVVKVN